MKLIALVLAGQVALGQVRVIDGDTVEAGGWRYRLAGIDAPELRGAACPAERAIARRAADRLGELVAGGAVAIADPDAPGRKVWTLDRYGRRLARLEAGGRDLGAQLVAEGLAAPWDPANPKDWCGG